MFKPLNNDQGRLSDLFHQSITSRKGKIVQLNRYRYEIGQNSLRFRGPVVWNRLPKDTRECKSLQSFKFQLKREKKCVDDISFEKGTVTLNNKNPDFIYF